MHNGGLFEPIERRIQPFERHVNLPSQLWVSHQLMLRNANSLQWLKDGRVLFSEFKVGSHLGVVISDEGRGESRDVYVPPPDGMAHYSDMSSDGSQVVIAEMAGGRVTAMSRDARTCSRSHWSPRDHEKRRGRV